MEALRMRYTIASFGWFRIMPRRVGQEGRRGPDRLSGGGSKPCRRANGGGSRQLAIGVQELRHVALRPVGISPQRPDVRAGRGLRYRVDHRSPAHRQGRTDVNGEGFALSAQNIMRPKPIGNQRDGRGVVGGAVSSEPVSAATRLATPRVSRVFHALSGKACP